MADPHETGEVLPGSMALVPAGAGLPPSDLVLWPDHETARAVAVQAVPGDIAETLGIEGPFQLGGRQVDAAAAFLVAAAAGLRRMQVEAGPAPTPPVEISLEAARQEPDSIIGMVRTAPRTEFHERVIGADVDGFEKTFAGYRQEGRKGLWKSLKLTTDEYNAYATLGIRKGRARRRHRKAVADLKGADEAPFVTGAAAINPLGKSGLSETVLGYIMILDEQFVSGQPGAAEGRGAVRGSPRTRERIERLMAVRYEEESGSTAATLRPAQAGAARVAEMLGDEQAAAKVPRPRDPEVLKLKGLKAVLTSLWADYRKQQKSLDDSGEIPSDSSSMGVPDELVELEALHAALLARARHKARDTKGAEMGLLDTIVGMEETMAAAEDGSDPSGVLGLDAGEYSEIAFRRDVLLAGTAWRVVSRQQPREVVAAFEQTVDADLRRKLGLEGPAGQDSNPSFTRSVLEAVRFSMGPEAYQQARDQALGQLAESGALGVASAAQIAWLAETHAGTVARERNRGGRYSESQQRDDERIVDDQEAKDFPPQGRMFVYYGNVGGELREADGDMGVLEAFGALSGAYEHIESASLSPMESGPVRAHLQRLAKMLGIDVEVHRPFKGWRKSYRCEAAHLIGAMPAHITPDLVLSAVCPNGLATLSWNSNRKLAAQLRQLGAGRARFSMIPTELIRFLQTPEGSTEPALGHADPRWKAHWKEYTMAIFFNKDDDGSESDLYQLLKDRLPQTIPELPSSATGA